MPVIRSEVDAESARRSSSARRPRSWRP